MKLELLFIIVTLFIVYNIYYDGKYLKMLMSYKKHFQIGFYIFLAIILYLMIKKNPDKTKSLLYHTNNMIKMMPIDNSALNLISPIIDFTENKNTRMFNQNNNIMSEINNNDNPLQNIFDNGNTSGSSNIKRTVSETKKKYVASGQDWCCGNCKTKLSYTFEVDHIIALKNGGTNDASNLVALCPGCHREKTSLENMR
jgi:5-methylcytosine-specific restriction endonuclease McrA